jgi:acetyl-CoA acyltransferase
VSHAYPISGERTPFGRYGGALSSVRTDDLATHVVRSVVESHPSVDWERRAPRSRVTGMDHHE